MQKLKKHKKGMAAAAVGALVTLIVGVGIATLVLIFIGTLGGSTYTLQQDNIDSLAVRYNEVYVTVYTENYTYLGYAGLEAGSFTIVNFTTNASVAESAIVIDYQHGYVAADAVGLYNESLMNFSFIKGDSTIQQNVKDSAMNAFKAQAQTANYLPLIVLAIVITLVLALVLGMGVGGMGGMNAGKGGAL